MLEKSKGLQGFILGLGIVLTQIFAQSSEAGQTELRVLIYNVQGVFTASDSSRFGDIGRLLGQMRAEGQGPHIVALQEVFGERTRPVAALSGYTHVQSGPSGGGARIRSGLQVLSEYPIERASEWVYSQCSSWDCLANKGAQYVRIRVPGVPSPIEVFNTHLNSNPDTDFWTPESDASDARFAQMQELRDFISETRVSHFPALFLGDFNFRAGSDELESWLGFMGCQDALLECASRPSECRGADVARAIARSTIDFQFKDDGRSPRVQLKPIEVRKVFDRPIRGRMLSDHFGIEVRYQITW